MKDLDKIKKLLQGFSPKPDSSELKGRIWQAAVRKEAASRVMTPFLKRLVIASAVCLFFISLGDLILSHYNQENMLAVVSSSSEPDKIQIKKIDSPPSDLQQFLGDTSLTDWLKQRSRHITKPTGADHRSQLKRILKEEFNEK